MCKIWSSCVTFKILTSKILKEIISQDGNNSKLDSKYLIKSSLKSHNLNLHLKKYLQLSFNFKIYKEYVTIDQCTKLRFIDNTLSEAKLGNNILKI